MQQSINHPLELRSEEAAYFTKQCPNGAAAYRRAVEACTGSLPTWAARRPGVQHKPRRKPEPVHCQFDE